MVAAHISPMVGIHIGRNSWSGVATIPLSATVSDRLDGLQIKRAVKIRLDVEALRRDQDMDRWFRHHPEIGDDELGVESLVINMQTCMEELKRGVSLLRAFLMLARQCRVRQSLRSDTRSGGNANRR
jgi:hypothetical protein